jgi:hypothetical protein
MLVSRAVGKATSRAQQSAKPGRPMAIPRAAKVIPRRRWSSPATPKKTAAVLDTLGIEDGVIAHGTPTTSIVLPNHRCKRFEVLPCQA